MGEAAFRPSEEREIGVGMLGYGFMGKAHSRAFIDVPLFFPFPPVRSRLVAIYGRTEKGLSDAAKRYGYRRYYTDWRKVVADGEVQIVDNVLPNIQHLEPCLAAFDAGKHVICEKPLAWDLAEARTLQRASSQAHVKSMVAFNYRFVPAIQFARQLINEGHLGRIVQFRASYLQDWIMGPEFPLVWRLRKEIAGSGALGDLGSHMLDLARLLVGEVASVCGMAKTFQTERQLLEDPKQKGKVDVDDAFISMLRFENGAIGSVEASRFTAGRKNFARIEVHGTKGSLGFNMERLGEIEFYSSDDPDIMRGYKRIVVGEQAHPYGENWWPVGHVLGWGDVFINEAHHFVDCVANDKPVGPLGATFDDGCKNNEILEAIARSIEKNSWISLPL